MLIKMKRIGKIYGDGQISTHALSNINLEIHQGEFVSFVGPSGCGKSTLLSLLGLLDTSTTGEYVLNGEDVANLSRAQRASIRNRQIGFVFQAFNLISDLTVAENVALPLGYREDLKGPDISQRVNHALEQVDLFQRQNYFPSQLSGGQQQRVALARALAGKPTLILADEPTGNLDSKNANGVLDLLSECHQQGTAVCMVTHDPQFASRAQRTVELFDGRIVSDSGTSP